jgi:acyl dehydratase
MTRSLTVNAFWDIIDLRGFTGFVNYGVKRMRLPQQLLVGDRVRARVKFVDLRDFPSWADLTTQLTFEIDGAEKPACWVEWVARGYEQRTIPSPGCAR